MDIKFNSSKNRKNEDEHSNEDELYWESENDHT
jgi:hypothetical protein